MDSVDKPITLKDGRVLSSSHNNFKRWVTDTKGNKLPVTEEYYNKTKILKIQ